MSSSSAKILWGIGVVILLIGGVWVISHQGAKEEARSNQPLMGEEMANEGANHIPEGAQAIYQSNPPTSGPHYKTTQPAGIYEAPVPDGSLIHSMEHGAVILWYKSDLPADQVEKLKQAFQSADVRKKIMVPRVDLDVPVALTSWRRLLTLSTIDEATIVKFLVTNEDRGPEKAPL